MKIAVNEIFGPTIQGEGPSTGRRAIFLRLAGCNLACSWCDTPYTWDWHGKNGHSYDKQAETHVYEVIDVVDTLEHRMARHGVSLLVITGGEPLLQQKALGELLLRLLGSPMGTYRIEIETNGTIAPDYNSALYDDVYFNVSPKLAHSGNDDRRIDPKALQTFAMHGADFKFVVETAEDFHEIDTLLESVGLPRHSMAGHLWAMPQGKTVQELHANMPEMVDLAVAYGFNFTSRLHIEVWGDERGK